MYKYTLDKSSNKFYCPSCQKKRFVRYVETITNNYTDFIYGRCDRETSCCYHLVPGNNTLTKTISAVQQIKTKPSILNDNVIGQYGNNYNNNNFISFLKLHFSYPSIEIAIKKYMIGTSQHWPGSTIFWQIDEFINIRTGKLMLYNSSDGTRVKHPYPHINWMHKVLNIKDFVLQQCLFGIHNLCDYLSDSLIGIVESEKTAVIMSILYPDYLWLATGSKSNLKLELIKPLKNYKVILYPDKSAYQDWQVKSDFFIQHDYNIQCSNFLENMTIEEGADLADLLIYPSL